MSGAQMYHSSIPGSSFICKDGTREFFDGTGRLETTDEELIKELDAISDKPGSPVFKRRAEAAMPAGLTQQGAEALDPSKIKVDTPIDPLQTAIKGSAAAGTLNSQQLATAKP